MDTGALKKSCEDIILDIAIKAIVTYWNFSLHTTFKMNIPFLVPLIFMIKSLDGRRSNHSVIRYESRTTLLSYCGNEGRPDLSREDPFYFSVRFIRLWFKHNFLQSLHRKPWHII
ncbi:hypothetical protein MKW98_021967 [Papaver atlanticum]|uniref:Uncharacterized protein n=1 Tax=Papaver atlanticum TaxID=357466 RepID=A0AAD4TMG6_9MAGN|nr:hypothetical protein MKW98_021967 [Papaver atlanticum]